MSMKIFFTPEGGRFFNNEDEVLDYISEKCGKDVADYFRVYEDILNVLYENSPCDLEEELELYDIDKTAGYKSPILELKRLREIKAKTEDLIRAYRSMYDKV